MRTLFYYDLLQPLADLLAGKKIKLKNFSFEDLEFRRHLIAYPLILISVILRKRKMVANWKLFVKIKEIEKRQITD